MTMTELTIILLFSVSALSPWIGLFAAKLSKSSGDAAGKGMGQGLAILLFMFLASLIGGISSSILWACSETPLPFYLKVLVILTYLAPYIFIAITEFLLPKLKK